MDSNRPRIEISKGLSGTQQAMLAFALLLVAVLIGSVIFLSLAVPNNWLIPAPNNVYERNIFAALQSVKEAKATQKESPSEENEKNYADAQSILVLAYLEAGNIEKATESLGEMIANSGENVRTYYIQARMLLMEENYQSGLEMIEKALKYQDIAPDELLRELYAMQGQAFRETNQGMLAFGSYSNAAHISPASATYFALAGDVALEQNMIDEAIQSYVKAITFDPQHLRANSQLSLLKEKYPAEVKKVSEKEKSSK